MEKTFQSSDEKGFLGAVERVFNKLPHVFILFLILISILAFISLLMEGTVFINPVDGKELQIKNLLSSAGIAMAFTTFVSNFTAFPPYVLAIVVLLGVGVAEESGYLSAMMRATMASAPRHLLTVAVIFVGVMGNMASTAAIIIIPPLGAMVFKAAGRHPVVGLIAGYVGTTIGLNANLLIVGSDVILSGISTKAAMVLDPTYFVSPAANWYFLASSVVFLCTVGAVMCEKYLEPRVNREYPVDGDTTPIESLTDKERKALRYSHTFLLFYFVFLAMLTFIPGAPLNSLKVFLASLIPILVFFFIVLALPYGIIMGKIKNGTDFNNLMGNGVKTFANVTPTFFIAAQFVAYLMWSNLDKFLAIEGANALQALELSGPWLLTGLIGIVSFINPIIETASGKWAMLAPIVVPMFMQLGISPELTQVAYRIADSCTNGISPINALLLFIVAMGQKYSSKIGLGSVISMMLPFSIVFLILWTAYFLIWYLLGLPIGPGANLVYPPV